ncbi:MAG: tetratricopeptide repeat protein [Pseudomonadota bacterium]|nr:tetratricopeptide repeat protein [Pseudomonadota bacterium]
MRAALAADTDNLQHAIRLAEHYVEIGRAKADPRYYGYVQATLRPWWDQPQPPPEVLLMRASLRQNRHDFDGALDDLRQLLQRQPGNAQAWLMQAVIHTVRGEYP